MEINSDWRSLLRVLVDMKEAVICKEQSYVLNSLCMFSGIGELEHSETLYKRWLQIVENMASSKDLAIRKSGIDIMRFLIQNSTYTLFLAKRSSWIKIIVDTLKSKMASSECILSACELFLDSAIRASHWSDLHHWMTPNSLPSFIPLFVKAVQHHHRQNSPGLVTFLKIAIGLLEVYKGSLKSFFPSIESLCFETFFSSDRELREYLAYPSR